MDIKIVGDNNYLPIIGQVGAKNSGILLDRLFQVGKELNINFSIELYPWARALTVAENENVGIIGISKNQEREKKFDYSEPIYIDSILMVVKKGKEFPFRDLNDLKGKVIGAQLDASFGESVDRYIKENKIIVERDRARENRLHKLLVGRIDVAFIGNGIEGFNQIVKSDPELLAKRDDFVILSKTLNEDKLYLTFKKELHKKDLLDKINLSIQKHTY